VTAPPFPPLGLNANGTELRTLCASRKYQQCFGRALARRYSVLNVYSARAPNASALEGAARELRHHGLHPRSRLSEQGAGPARGCGVDGDGDGAAPLVGELKPRHRSPWSGSSLAAAALRFNASATAQPASDLAALLAFTAKPPADAGAGSSRRCDDDAATLNHELQLLLGVPSQPGPIGKLRRQAARAGWMAALGRSALACFLVSAYLRADELDALLPEAKQYGDVLFVQAAETGTIIRARTRYSNFTKRGRGMPTFKQYAFFQLAAAVLPSVPFVGKVDDDTAVNVRLLLPLLRALRCLPHAFIGAINWAAVVPRATWSGVRADRCGFGWDLDASLSNYGQSYGQRGTKSFQPACDDVGAVLPLPYATGAGYVFSARALQYVATDADVVRWVAEAGGVERESLQWQKFEDTTTGYWLSYSPQPITYVNIGRWVHDFACHPEGARVREGGALYRPPAAHSLLVHNLKRGGFAYSSDAFSPTTAYDHQRCTRDSLWRKPAAEGRWRLG